MTDFANFDRAAEYYDETRGFPPGVDAKVAAWIAETVGLSPESRLLEVGVGTGRIAVPLAAHVGQIVGVDIARAMMARIHQKSPAKPIDLAEADAQHLPFAANSFDVC